MSIMLKSDRNRLVNTRFTIDGHFVCDIGMSNFHYFKSPVFNICPHFPRFSNS